MTRNKAVCELAGGLLLCDNLGEWRDCVAEWQMYQPNPAARNVGDCAIRALSKALGIDWETAYALTANAGFLMNDLPNSDSVWGSVLRQRGFYRHIIPNTCPDCYTIGQFAEDHPRGVYVVGTGGHVVTVENGVVYDSWDSRREIPIFYWEAE